MKSNMTATEVELKITDGSQLLSETLTRSFGPLIDSAFHEVMNHLIRELYSPRWSGDLANSSVVEMRKQLQKTLQNQMDGYWSGHTAYNIAVDGGFLIDGKKCSNKRLTELGRMFMEQQADE